MQSDTYRITFLVSPGADGQTRSLASIQDETYRDVWHSPNCSACLTYHKLNLLKPTGYVMHQQFNIQQLYLLPTLYLCVLYLSENKQRLVPLTA